MPTAGQHRPLRRLLFQPWKWPPWLLVGIVAFIPVVYFFSAVPVLRMAEEHGRWPWVARWLDHFYLPVGLAAESVALLGIVVEWESGFMDRIYGPPGVTTDNIDDAIRAL